MNRYWRSVNWLTFLLLPLTVVFCVLVWLRRQAYQRGWRKTVTVTVPVVVVGNISVGGTGKTPMVVALVAALQQAGYHPGVISRGYRGRAEHWPQAVTPQSDPTLVGDEPVLLANRCHCPVMVGPDRMASIHALLQQHPCDVIVSDDGMQHYRMGRSIEIAVIDGAQRFGNGLCLPAGPLREPISRLQTVDLVVANGAATVDEFQMTLHALSFNLVRDPGQTRAIESFNGKTVHAVAGIGNPGRFFQHLIRLGLQVKEHAFADHHDFCAEDFQFEDDSLIIMTEKDAVKCRAFASERFWYMAIEGRLETEFFTRFSTLLMIRPGNG